MRQYLEVFPLIELDRAGYPMRLDSAHAAAAKVLERDRQCFDAQTAIDMAATSNCGSKTLLRIARYSDLKLL